MEIERRRRGRTEILELRGRAVGLSEAALVQDHVGVLLARPPAALVIDLTRIERMDSGFVGQLLVCRDRTQRAAVELKLVAAGVPRDVLNMAGLESVFDVFESVDAALRDVESARPDAG